MLCVLLSVKTPNTPNTLNMLPRKKSLPQKPHSQKHFHIMLSYDAKLLQSKWIPGKNKMFDNLSVPISDFVSVEVWSIIQAYTLFFIKLGFRASLVAQWLRICLPMQGARVRALVWEDPTCRGATRPMSHNYWACASGACAPQQERPRQWEARAPRWRVAPTCHN